MKIKGWVATARVGSRWDFTVKIDDGDLEGMTTEEQNLMIDEAVRDAMLEHLGWGWDRATDRG